MKTYFGKNLKHLMKEHGVEVQDIVNQLGITQQSVSKWLNSPGDKLPSVSVQNLIVLSEIFNTSVDDLIKKDIASGEDIEISLQERVDEAMKTLKKVRDELKRKGRDKLKGYQMQRSWAIS
jgi:transcriptional regulator with XRE-family HTH domain